MSMRAASAGGGDSLVDTKGVGQPFKLTGKMDSQGRYEQDFSEWALKMTTYAKAKFGMEIEKALKWAVKQRKMKIVESAVTENQVGYDDAFGETSDDPIENFDKVVSGLYMYLISFTTGPANKIVRNAGSDNGLEAWKGLHNQYDPTSALRRVTILQLVQNPHKCQKLEDVGAALEDWIAKKNQYEEFTDEKGDPCRLGSDSAMAALYKLMPKHLEDQLMLSAGFDNFNDVFNKLVSLSSTRLSMMVKDKFGNGGKTGDDPMDIGAFGKGKKGKGKEKGGASKCHKCGKIGHWAKDCRSGGKGKGKGEWKGKGHDHHHSGGSKQDSIQCWKCFQYGHMGKDCPNGQKIGGGKGSSKDSGKGGKGKGFKGKGKSVGALDGTSNRGDWEANSWEATGWTVEQWLEPPKTQRESEAEFGCVELNYLGQNLEVPWIVKDKYGTPWVKVNYDSGAAVTAFPVEMMDGEILEEFGTFTVANGATIPNYGRRRFGCEDELGGKKGIKASITTVHKPLGSASEFSETHDSILWSDGGYLLPKSSEIAKEMRAEFDRLSRLHGLQSCIPLWREGSLYNFYLKMDESPTLAPVSGSQPFQRPVQRKL